MQQSRIDRQNRTLILRPHTGASKLDAITILHFARRWQVVKTYLYSISFVRLIVSTFHIIRRIIAFIMTHFLRTKPDKRPITDVTVVTPVEQTTAAIETEYDEQRLRDNFLTMASHELKTPMTTILGQAQLMLRRISRIPELSSDMKVVRGALESIDGQTRRLNTLVDDLLDLYTIRAGKVELRLQPCNLTDICQEAVNEQRLLTGRTIHLDVPVAPVIMHADEDRLAQVVVNLVTNALKYSPEENAVQVIVDKRRDIGIVEVYDNGPGIHGEELTHIFEPFYRCSNVRATANSGLGLGLAICKEVVERHGGRIWCRSRVGKGSVFIVEMPIKGHIAHHSDSHGEHCSL